MGVYTCERGQCTHTHLLGNLSYVPERVEHANVTKGDNTTESFPATKKYRNLQMKFDHDEIN